MDQYLVVALKGLNTCIHHIMPHLRRPTLPALLTSAVCPHSFLMTAAPSRSDVLAKLVTSHFLELGSFINALDRRQFSDSLLLPWCRKKPYYKQRWDGSSNPVSGLLSTISVLVMCDWQPGAQTEWPLSSQGWEYSQAGSTTTMPECGE